MAGAPSVRRLSSDCRVYALTPCVEPAYHVAPGETLVIETADAMDGQIPALGRCVAEVDASRANPLTGPIAVEGAEPRMMLAVQILEVAVAQEGWMSRSPSGAVCPVTDNLA